MLLIAPIIAAFFSRGRWWVVPLVALCWAGALETVRMQLISGYRGGDFGLHLGSALLAGFVVLGIATVIRKLRGAPPRVDATQEQVTGE